MPDLSITAAAGLVGLVSGVLGVGGTLYARARADGRRDRLIEELERRVNVSADQIAHLEGEGHKTSKIVARLETKMDALAESAKETREILRELARK